MRILPSNPLYEKMDTLNRVLCIAVNREPRTEFEHMPEFELIEFVDGIKNLIRQEIEVNTRSLN